MIIIKKANKPINDIAALAGTRLLTMLISIGQIMILSRGLDKFNFGTYSQALIVIQISTSLTAFGLSSAVNYFLAQSFPIEKKEKYFNTIIGINFLSGCIGALLLFIFKNLIGDYFANPVLASLMIYIAFRPMFTNLVTDFQNSFIANSMTGFISIRNLIIAFIQISIIGLATFLGFEIKYIFVLLILLDVGQLVFFFLLANRIWYPIRILRISKDLVKEIFIYSVPMALALMVGTLNIEVDKLLIGHFFSTEQLAEYANMSKELPFSFIALSISTVMLPKIIRAYKDGNKELAKQLWSDSMTLGFLFSTLFCFLALLLSNEIIRFLYTEKYANGEPVFRVFVILQMVRFTYFGTILNAAGKTKTILRLSILTLVINIILCFLFYRLFGYFGPAYATLISVIFMAGSQVIQSRKLLQCSIFEIINLKYSLLFISTFLIVSFIFSFLKNGLYKLRFNSLAVLLIIGLLYVVVCIALLISPLKKLLLKINAGSDLKSYEAFDN